MQLKKLDLSDLVAEDWALFGSFVIFSFSPEHPTNNKLLTKG